MPLFHEPVSFSFLFHYFGAICSANLHDASSLSSEELPSSWHYLCFAYCSSDLKFSTAHHTTRRVVTRPGSSQVDCVCAIAHLHLLAVLGLPKRIGSLVPVLFFANGRSIPWLSVSRRHESAVSCWAFLQIPVHAICVRQTGAGRWWLSLTRRHESA